MICISYLKWRPSLRSRMGAELLGLCTQKWFIKKTKYFAQFRNLFKKNEWMHEWIDWWSGMNECVCTCCECEWRERESKRAKLIRLLIRFRFRFDGAECASEWVSEWVDKVLKEQRDHLLRVLYLLSDCLCLVYTMKVLASVAMLHVACCEWSKAKRNKWNDWYIEYDNVECECECECANQW